MHFVLWVWQVGFRLNNKTISTLFQFFCRYCVLFSVNMISMLLSLLLFFIEFVNLGAVIKKKQHFLSWTKIRVVMKLIKKKYFRKMYIFEPLEMLKNIFIVIITSFWSHSNMMLNLDLIVFHINAKVQSTFMFFFFTSSSSYDRCFVVCAEFLNECKRPIKQFRMWQNTSTDISTVFVCCSQTNEREIIFV